MNRSDFIAHPIYELYLANPKTGEVIHKKHMNVLKSLVNNRGYILINVRGSNTESKTMSAHRFVWECVNGSIPVGKEIDHINDIRYDNRIENLQLLTRRENLLKSAKNRNYDFIKNNHKNRKEVIAIDPEGNEKQYRSMYACQKDLSVNAGIIKYCCDGMNNVNGGYSKIDGMYFQFRYVN